MVTKTIDEGLFEFINLVYRSSNINKINNFPKLVSIDNGLYNSIASSIQNWQDYKVEIYSHIKRFYLDYQSRNTIKEDVVFPDFYEKILVPNLNNLFDKLKETTNQHNIVENLKSFLYKNCLDTFIHDLSHEHINKIYTNLNTKQQYIKKLMNKVVDLNNVVKDQSKNLTIQSKNLKKQSKQIDKTSNENARKNIEISVTILGVFVGVVMVFFGGFSILTNAISEMTTATSYRITFTMIAFGGILYNVVILLFFLICRITSRSIACKCYNYELNEENPIRLGNLEDDFVDNKCRYCTLLKHKRFKGICRIRRIYPYIYWGNVIIVALILFVFGLKFLANENNPLNLTLRQIILSSIGPITIFLVAFICPRNKSNK